MSSSNATVNFHTSVPVIHATMGGVVEVVALARVTASEGVEASVGWCAKFVAVT